MTSPPHHPDEGTPAPDAPTPAEPASQRVRSLLRRNAILFKFYGLFGLFMAAFYLGTLHGRIDGFFTTGYPSFIAEAVAWLLNALGVTARTYRNQVHMSIAGQGSFAYTIVSGCTGVFAMMIYASAVLAYPARWYQRALGIVLGVPSLMAINITRLVMLGFVGLYRRDLFEYFHEVLWQGIFIVFVIALWMSWRWIFVDGRGGPAPAEQPMHA